MSNPTHFSRINVAFFDDKTLFNNFFEEKLKNEQEISTIEDLFHRENINYIVVNEKYLEDRNTDEKENLFHFLDGLSDPCFFLFHIRATTNDGDQENIKNRINRLRNILKDKYPYARIGLTCYSVQYNSPSYIENCSPWRLISKSSLVSRTTYTNLEAFYKRNPAFKSVFISHSKENRSVAKPFYNTLKTIFGDDVEVFYSNSIQNNTPSGKDIIDHIKDKIVNSNIAFVLLSKDYLECKVCQLELGAIWGCLTEIQVKFIIVKDNESDFKLWNLGNKSLLYISDKDKLIKLFFNSENQVFNQLELKFTEDQRSKKQTVLSNFCDSVKEKN